MNPRHWVLIAVPSCLVAVQLASPSFAASGGTVMNPYNATAAICVAIAASGTMTRQERSRAPWWAITLTLALWLAGDIVYEILGNEPTASVADLMYLGGYVSLISAMWILARSQVAGARDRALDIGVATIAGTYATWELVVRPLWAEDGASVAGRILSSSYPIADIVILLLGFRLLLAPGRKSAARIALAAGAVLLFVADTVYAVLAQTASYGGDTRVLDSLWLLAYAALAIACHAPTGRSDTTVSSTAQRVTLADATLGVLALLTVPAVVAISHRAGHVPNEIALLVTAASLTMLVVTRFARLTNATTTAHHQVETSERYYRALTVHSSDVIVVIGDDDQITDISRALAGLVGSPFEDQFRADPGWLVHPEDRARALGILADARARPGHPVTGEVRLRPYDEIDHWIELRCTDLSSDPAVNGVVVNARDITDRKRVEADLEHQALHDALTGLPNRALFRNRIDHALARLDRNGGAATVLFCDIDVFKSVNESLGQHSGDILLKQVGTRLTDAVRASDTVARIGGDEFAILIDSVGDLAADTDRAVERIRDSLSEPFSIADVPVVVTCCFGVASAGHHAPAADELIRNADVALYHAKREGRGTMTTYSPSMGAATANRLQLEADLRVAVRHDELVLHYQPVVDLATGTVRGFEALVRWAHPRRGLLMPGDFITIAEETGMIVEIGDWVLRTACATAARWAALAPERPPLEMSVNLSGRQLAEPGLADQVVAAIAETGIDPHLLVLELTESVLVERSDEANVHFGALGALGIRLAIDDFGTGYSSLAYLQQFSVDIVKIDREFVQAIHGETVTPLIRGMLDLGRMLGAACTAEGIEEAHQASALAEAGCPLGQGYLFSRPVDVDAASAMAHGNRRLSADTSLRS